MAIPEETELNVQAVHRQLQTIWLQGNQGWDQFDDVLTESVEVQCSPAPTHSIARDARVASWREPLGEIGHAQHLPTSIASEVERPVATAHGNETVWLLRRTERGGDVSSFGTRMAPGLVLRGTRWSINRIEIDPGWSAGTEGVLGEWVVTSS